VKLLLDTHVLVWAAYASPKLPANAASLIGDDGNQRFFSAASIWEIAIKARLGRPDFRVEASLLRNGLLANGYFELPITSVHAITAAKLPFAHKDPFDRMLLAQALEEGLTLLSADDALIDFGPPVLAI
jgi:PIN domain nuclease of toxin-antitoxin system